MALLNEFVKVIPNLFWNETVYKQTNKQTEENHHYQGKNVSSGGRAVIILLQALNFFSWIHPTDSQLFQQHPGLPAPMRHSASCQTCLLQRQIALGHFPALSCPWNPICQQDEVQVFKGVHYLLPVCLCKPHLLKSSSISTETWLASCSVLLTVPQTDSFFSGSCTCSFCCSQCRSTA